MTTETVREGYRHCQQVTRAAARNFYCAFITLPRPQRMAIYAAYAFARICDDIADDDLAPLEKARRLAEVRRDLHTACQGQPRGPVFSALGDVVSRYSVPERYLQDIIKGVEMDLTITRYEDFPALMEYCRHVASAVGLICTRIFGGADASLEPLASDLGVAMQLTNILRDVREDAARGRIYLPQDELRRFGYTEEELMAGVVNEAFVALMKFQTERARHYFANGMRLVPLLPWRSRACPAVLGRLYSRVLDRIEERGFNVFQGRVSLSSREKLLFALSVWARTMALLPRRAAA